MANIQQDIQDKVKIKVVNTPFNMQGEIVFDFKNTRSLTISLYPKYRTVDISERLNVIGPINTDDVYKVKDIQVVGEQQAVIADLPAGAGDSDGTARAGINAILAVLRTHGLIKT